MFSLFKSRGGKMEEYAAWKAQKWKWLPVIQSLHLACEHVSAFTLLLGDRWAGRLRRMFVG